MTTTVEGYPQIAQLMSQHNELAIVRIFGGLNMLNLLHMQAELMHLEEKYHRLSDADGKTSSQAFRSRDLWSLTQMDCQGKREQWDTLLEIRLKLREYSKFKLPFHLVNTSFENPSILNSNRR